MPKKSTSTKKATQRNSSKVSFWRRLPTRKEQLMIVTGCILLALVGWIATYYVKGYLKDQADKEKFVKVEALVNNVKADLEKAFPEKKWEIVKFCDPLKGELGNIIDITCEYGVKGADVQARDIDSTIQKYVAGELSTNKVETGNRFASISGASCLSASSSILGGGTWQANFYCLSTTNLFIYPEHDYSQ